MQRLTLLSTARHASSEVANTVRVVDGGEGFPLSGLNRTSTTPGMAASFRRPVPPRPMTRPQNFDSTSKLPVTTAMLSVPGPLSIRMDL